MNVPNVLTLFRVVFAIAVFVFIAFANYDLCLLFFTLAALTDFIDGWWARKFKQVTVFGRIMDPFADKFLICGVFICLLGVPAIMFGVPGFASQMPSWLLFQPWMVVVIVARELLITSLRAFVEKGGGDFSAKWIGKWKMGFQCLAVISCFVYLAGIQYTATLRSPDIELAVHWGTGWIAPLLSSILRHQIWLPIVFYTMIASLWATVAITLYSGVTYCINAARIIRSQ